MALEMAFVAAAMEESRAHLSSFIGAIAGLFKPEALQSQMDTVASALSEIYSAIACSDYDAGTEAAKIHEERSAKVSQANLAKLAGFLGAKRPK
jgi:hypothetical protein